MARLCRLRAWLRRSGRWSAGKRIQLKEIDASSQGKQTWLPSRWRVPTPGYTKALRGWNGALACASGHYSWTAAGMLHPTGAETPGRAGGCTRAWPGGETKEGRRRSPATTVRLICLEGGSGEMHGRALQQGEALLALLLCAFFIIFTLI